MNQYLVIFTILLYASLVRGQSPTLGEERHEFSFSALEQVSDIEILRFTNYRGGSNLKPQPKYPDHINGLLGVVRKQVLIGISSPVPKQSFKIDTTGYDEDQMGQYSIIYGIYDKLTGDYFFRLRQTDGSKKNYSSVSFNLSNNQITRLSSPKLWEWTVANLKYKQFNRLFQGVYASNDGVKLLRQKCSDDELAIPFTSLHCMLETLSKMDDENQRIILEKLNKKK